MTDLLERLRFDAARCEATFSKGIATNIEGAITEIERLRATIIELRAEMYGEVGSRDAEIERQRAALKAAALTDKQNP